MGILKVIAALVAGGLGIWALVGTAPAWAIPVAIILLAAVLLI